MSLSDLDIEHLPTSDKKLQCKYCNKYCKTYQCKYCDNILDPDTSEIHLSLCTKICYCGLCFSFLFGSLSLLCASIYLLNN